MNFKRYHVSRNLFDKYAEHTTGQTAYQYTISGLTPNQKYTCSTNFVAQPGKEASIYFNGGSTGTNGVAYSSPKTFTCGSTGTMNILVRFEGISQSNPAIYDDLMNGAIWIMLNEGSQPLPYEPYSSEVWHDIPHYIHNTSTDTLTTLPAEIYANDTTATVGLKGQMEQTGAPTPENPITPSECGDLETSGAKAGQYKIPISSANTTTPVYLGEVQTERKIKKLVLTGNETFFRDKERADSWRFYSDALVSGKYNVSICSHFAYIGTSRVNDTDDIGFSLFSSSQFGCRCPKSVANTVNEFKAWLAAQYSAGTPVTVWYVLATETTGIVNEPLRKIGGYADTVSGITIPTITGKDSFDVLTTLKPSEVSLTYTGWHDATVKEWDGTDWQ